MSYDGLSLMIAEWPRSLARILKYAGNWIARMVQLDLELSNALGDPLKQLTIDAKGHDTKLIESRQMKRAVLSREEITNNDGTAKIGLFEDGPSRIHTKKRRTHINLRGQRKLEPSNLMLGTMHEKGYFTPNAAPPFFGKQTIPKRPWLGPSYDRIKEKVFDIMVEEFDKMIDDFSR